ncbi:MAG: flagellar biosynthesis protein FlhB [Alphaproteobacteria bacterium]|nr:flagellar biosynthesis protein FlhB [Alphaproteobacteria bacterium]
MADQDNDDDDKEKTEEPSQRKLEKAREEGNTIFSKEIITLCMIITSAITVLYVLPWSSKTFIKDNLIFIDRPHTFHVQQQATLIGWHVYVSLLKILGPTMVIILFGALFGGLVQKWGAITFKSIKPKMSNLSLKKGFQKIFSMNNLFETFKNVMKLILLTTALYLSLHDEKDALRAWLWLSLNDFSKVLFHLNFVTYLGLIIAFSFMAIGDYYYQRFTFLKKMRMSKYDLKQEHKESEGSPEIKQKLRQIRLEKSRKRMMSEVPKATVILTNPTHYSIALKWDENSMNAPVVVAKGEDVVALRIREVAKNHNVPIIENPPLTRALYASVKTEEEIPPKFYKAVAAVLRLVMNMKQHKPQF